MVFPFFAQAKSLKRSAFLDELTIEKGYTLSNNDFSLGIQPDTFSEAAKVYLRPYKKEVTLPTNLNLISSVYIYNIKIKEQSQLTKMIWLSLKYNSDSKYKKNLYYFNSLKGEWEKLAGVNDKENSLIKSGWFFPYSIVAVFEDPSQLEAPVKINNFSKFYENLDAASAIVIDELSGKILYQKNANEQRSIASLTKVMTALIFLETDTSMDNIITYHAINDREGARLYVSEGETMTVQDIFYTMLVGSANNCALTLADSTGLSREDFVIKMNEKAAALNLTNTYFIDPSGLEVGNVSSAADYAKLMQIALDKPEITAAMTTQNYSFYTINTNNYHSINSTDPILNWDITVTGGKTGYINEALYCMMLKAKEDDHEIITVLLGNPSSIDRFTETYNLSKWALSNYSW